MSRRRRSRRRSRSRCSSASRTSPRTGSEAVVHRPQGGDRRDRRTHRVRPRSGRRSDRGRDPERPRARGRRSRSHLPLDESAPRPGSGRRTRAPQSVAERRDRRVHCTREHDAPVARSLHAPRRAAEAPRNARGGSVDGVPRRPSTPTRAPLRVLQRREPAEADLRQVVRDHAPSAPARRSHERRRRRRRAPASTSSSATKPRPASASCWSRPTSRISSPSPRPSTSSRGASWARRSGVPRSTSRASLDP